MSMFFVIKLLICQTKRKNLKSSTICQYESVFSIFKSMQTSRLFYNFTPWTQIQMKRICQNQIDRLDILPNIFWIFENIQDQTFDRSLGPNWHKNWSPNLNSIKSYFSDSRIPLLFKDLKIQLSHTSQ